MKSIYVYAVPGHGAPFLMFIADEGEERAHANARRTRHLHTQEIVAYEFHDGAGVRRFDFEAAS